MQTKNLKASFRNLMQLTRNFAEKRNAVKQKSQTYKPQIETETKSRLKMKAGKQEHDNKRIE
jgi:hypothetical protein